MNESTRNEIIRLHTGGASMRRIARMLRISRHLVSRVIAAHVAARRGEGSTRDLPQKPAHRSSCLDDFEQTMRDLLARYPNITAVRMLEELKNQKFVGSYTIVRERLKILRPKMITPVIRFETAPGQQAQMDYSPYVIDFTEEGRRKVHAFNYVLGYSRRQYVHFVEREDFQTTVEEHIHAFQHLGGVAEFCLYDNMKVVVSAFDGDEPIYNTKFLAFATHYAFRPWACQRWRPQTKGKAERSLFYVEQNLLNARSFRGLAHLNEVTAWWLENHADLRIHPATNARPIDRHREEHPFLRPLPERHFEVADVVYRVVDVEGNIAYDTVFYSVPWSQIGDLVVVRATAQEIVVYGRDIVEIARHARARKGNAGQRIVIAREDHRPKRQEDQLEALRERFVRLDVAGAHFLEGLLRTRRYGRKEAAKILDLRRLYATEDLKKAIERAVHYHAFSFAAVERILGIQASPRAHSDLLAGPTHDHARQIQDGERVEPRHSREYQDLLAEPSKDPNNDERPEDSHGQTETGRPA